MAKLKTALVISSLKSLPDFNEISEKLNVKCTESRRKEDFPQCTKDAGLAHDYWCYEIICEEIDPDNTICLDYEIDKLFEVFGDKISIIKEICNEYDARVDITANAYEENYRIYMGLSKANIKFLYEINAEFCIEVFH